MLLTALIEIVVHQASKVFYLYNGKYYSIRAVNKNPGLLRQWSSYERRNGYAVFNSLEKGWWAFRFDVSRKIRHGATVAEFVETPAQALELAKYLEVKLKRPVQTNTKLEVFLHDYRG